MIASRLRHLARRLGRRALSWCVAAAALSPSAHAHPHVWVTARTALIYHNGAIVGLRHEWTFDQYYTEMAIEGLDKNNDGKYTREELAELAKINVEALKEFGYFTYPKLAGVALEVGPPKDYYLSHKTEPAKAAAVGSANGQPPAPAPKTGAAKIAEDAAKPVPVLTLHFTLPLAKPVLAEAEGFTFTVGDPSFFIAFEPAADDPVTLGEGAPKGCKVLREDEDQQAAANPSKPGDLMAGQPSDLSVNIVSGPVWKVACRPGG
ncbi:MAG: DUF1007 family protein [Hyphomicrobiaceae bacterium]